MTSSYHSLLSEERAGTLLFGGARMALLDIEAGFWALRCQMEALAGKRLTDVMLQQAGADGGASFARAFAGHDSGPDGAQALRDCVAAYQAAGFGRFELEVMQWPFDCTQDTPTGHVVVRGYDTFEAWMVRQHGQQSESPVCAYSAGVLVGFVNVLAGRQDVVCVERACQAQGADACLFELLPADAAGDVPVVAFAPDPALGRQLNLLEILFDRMPMGIAIFDRGYYLRRYNPTWADFAGRYSPPSASRIAPGVYYFDLLPGSEPIVVPLFERVLAGETVRQEAVRLESGGIVTHWDMVLAPLFVDGEVTGILNATVDATERVQAHQDLGRTVEALRESQQLLEQRVQERTHEIERRRQVAEGLRDVLAILNSDRPLDEILDYVARQAGRLLGANAAVIYRFQIAEELITVEAACGMPAGFSAFKTMPLTETEPNQAVLNRRPFAVPDLADRLKTAYPDAAQLPPGLGNWLAVLGKHFRAYLSVPLIVKDKVYGAVSLYYHETREFSDEEIGLATTLGDQAALAIENARLRQAEQNRQRELQTLLDVTTAASSSLELDEILSAVLDRLVALVGASRAGVVLLDRESGELEPRMIRPEHAVAPDDLAELARACRLVIASGEPLYAPVDAALGHVEPGALLPLRVRGQALGVLGIIGPKGSAFSEGHLALFESIADQLGVAMENARLFEQAEQTAVAAERNRLARDLHDAVTQTLFSASLIAEVLPRLWQRNPDEGQRRLKELRELTRGALAEMRTLLLELRPSALVDAELADLLRQLAESITGRARVPVTVEVEGECDLPVDVKVALYRIAHEALNNVAKHAGASRATVNLCCQAGRVALHVSDDGAGFDPESIPPESLGLGIMRERAEAIGAELTMESEIGGGTELTVEWTP